MLDTTIQNLIKTFIDTLDNYEVDLNILFIS